jgi:PAS domain S-box-containing protein
MNPSAKKNKGLKTEPEIKGQKKKSSLDKKSIENIPEINSKFFENSLDAMMIGSQDGRIYAANTAACKMLGWSEKEICRLGRNGIVEQNRQLTEAVRKRRKSGNFFGELTFIKKDGTFFPVEISSSVFTNSDGMEFTTLIIRDITERKKTEEALIKSEENYRLIHDNAIKELAKRKLVEKELFHQNTILAKLNKFSIELSKLSTENNLEAFIARQLKIISGARVTIFNEYSHSNRTIAVRHIEMEPQLLKKVVSLLSKQVNGIVSKVSKEDYQVMVSEIIGVRNTLYEASFGSIPKIVAAAIQRLINVDRFIGIAYIVDGKIYGTSLLAMDKDRPDPPKEILENFAFLTAMSLRRKQAEEALEEREAEYRSLFENSIMGISQSYPDGGFKRINKAYAEMYGYPDTSTMMKEVSSNVEMLYFHSEDRKKVLEILDKTGYMPPTEFELNRRNGEKFWALVSARKVKDNAGKLLYLQAEHRDITSRKKLEKDMYSASLYARSLIEASLDPLVTINAEGKITDVNLSTEKITGITRKKLIGSDFADYFENPDKARKGYKTVFSEGMVKDYPLSILHKSGRKIDVLYNATLFKNEKGEIQGVFAAARDITDLKKMEEELLKSHELLEKLNQHLINAIEEERNQIALNLHDDLGQKLTAINLDIAWLKSRIGVQSKTVREKFEEMSTMIKETIESIKETSSFLRPAILFDLGLVPAIKSQLDKFEKQTGIKCHFYFRPQEILLEDRLALILYRILQESLTNIARHSGASKVDVNLYVLKNKIEMIIKDDGTGIEENKVNSIKSLGIAGIKERVKSVDGKITIIGVHGSGTMIRVAIPLLKMKTND